MENALEHIVTRITDEGLVIELFALDDQPLSLLFRRCIQQPHHHEKGHHRSHEVRISDLPGTTVVATPYDFFLSLDDDRCQIALRAHISTTHLFTRDYEYAGCVSVHLTRGQKPLACVTARNTGR
jgi:hypothetical protein